MRGIWDGSAYVLAYGDTETGDIAVQRLDASGVKLGAATIVETTAPPSYQPSITKAPGGGYVVAWADGMPPVAVHTRGLDATGAPTGKGAMFASANTTEARPTLVNAFGKIAITWMDVDGGLPSVRAGFLDDGLAVAASPAPVRIGATTAAASHGWLVGGDASLAVTWSDARNGQRDIRFATLDGSLAVSNDKPMREGGVGDSFVNHATAIPDGYAVTWEDPRSGDTRSWMAVTGKDGTKSFEGLASQNTDESDWPSPAWTGKSIAIASYAYLGVPQIVVGAYDTKGAPLGAELQVSTAPQGQKARFPALMATGTDLGVAWVETVDGTAQLFFARVACP